MPCNVMYVYVWMYACIHVCLYISVYLFFPHSLYKFQRRWLDTDSVVTVRPSCALDIDRHIITSLLFLWNKIVYQVVYSYCLRQFASKNRPEIANGKERVQSCSQQSSVPSPARGDPTTDWGRQKLRFTCLCLMGFPIFSTSPDFITQAKWMGLDIDGIFSILP